MMSLKLTKYSSAVGFSAIGGVTRHSVEVKHITSTGTGEIMTQCAAVTNDTIN